MFDWSWKQLLVGLVIVAGVILLATIVMSYAFGPISVSSEGATLSFPKCVERESDPQKIMILIPKGYTYAQMATLEKALEDRMKDVDPEKYDPVFLDAFWTVAQAGFMFQRMNGVEVKIDGEFTAAINQFIDQSPNGFIIIWFMVGVNKTMGKLALKRYSLLPEVNIDTGIAEIKKKLEEAAIKAEATPATPAVPAAAAASYQSCGEGNCGCAGFKPYGDTPISSLSGKIGYKSFPFSMTGPEADTSPNMSSYGPLGQQLPIVPQGDITSSLLNIHKRESSRSQGSGFEGAVPEKMLLRGEKKIEVSPYYYAGLPTDYRSLYIGSPEEQAVSNPSSIELRPDPESMRIHQMGPYAEFPTYYRPSDQRAVVLETGGVS